ncbi:hypothetical protein LWI29_016669 [Acer saccharum]|uniref:RING-type E3 ubiquitin transferase n=1 Tax=Acer saccharum TaxID=4024 RepID=A0AA39RRQ9_ACESA|nr:hypothetical protein LWI29_016669 [Acer saccharum]
MPIHVLDQTRHVRGIRSTHSVGVLDEEKVIPLGKNISAIGICNFKNGIPEIKSCEDLPYFLTEMTTDQVVVDLADKTKILF